MDDAYEILKKTKHKDESFSEVIRRISSSQKMDIKKWLGKLNNNDIEETRIKIKKIRQETSEDIEKRLKRINRV